jgi:uncharacterized protein YlaI
MLIKRIQDDPILSEFLCNDCEERGVGIDVSDEVNRNDFIIIKVDEYYKIHEKSNNRPKSPDCLIIQHCGGNKFVLHIIELKSSESLSTKELNETAEKFQSCFSDFMSNRFREYFYDIDYDFSIRLFLVSNHKEREENRKTEPSRLDRLLTLKAFRFANRGYLLQHKTPNPTIKPCQ